MRLPYIFTAEGREEVSKAKQTVRGLEGKEKLSHVKSRRLDSARSVTRRDLYEKLCALGFATVVSAYVIGFNLPREEKSKERPAPAANAKDPDPVQVAEAREPEATVVPDAAGQESVVSGEVKVRDISSESPDVKEELLKQNGVSLRFDGEFTQEETTNIAAMFTRCIQRIDDDSAINAMFKETRLQCFCVDDMQLALLRLSEVYPGRVADITRSTHPDGFTISVVFPDQKDKSVHVTLLSKDIFQSEARTLGTLDHESGHVVLTMGGLLKVSRKEHEIKAYDAGIKRLQSMAERLRKGGKPDDLKLATELENVVIPDHQRKFKSWSRGR